MQDYASTNSTVTLATVSKVLTLSMLQLVLVRGVWYSLV